MIGDDKCFSMTVTSFSRHYFKVSHTGHLSVRAHDLRNLHVNVTQTRVRKEGGEVSYRCGQEIKVTNN